MYLRQAANWYCSEPGVRGQYSYRSQSEFYSQIPQQPMVWNHQSADQVPRCKSWILNICVYLGTHRPWFTIDPSSLSTCGRGVSGCTSILRDRFCPSGIDYHLRIPFPWMCFLLCAMRRPIMCGQFLTCLLWSWCCYLPVLRPLDICLRLSWSDYCHERKKINGSLFVVINWLRLRVY